MICCPHCLRSAEPHSTNRYRCRGADCKHQFPLEAAVFRDAADAPTPHKSKPRRRTQSGSGHIAGRITIGRGTRWWV